MLELSSISHLLFFPMLEGKDSTVGGNKAASSVGEAEELMEGGMGLSQGELTLYCAASKMGCKGIFFFFFSACLSIHHIVRTQLHVKYCSSPQ